MAHDICVCHVASYPIPTNKIVHISNSEYNQRECDESITVIVYFRWFSVLARCVSQTRKKASEITNRDASVEEIA